MNLIKVRHFKNDPKWIAKSLGITSSEAGEALDRLFSLGLLSEREGKLEAAFSALDVKTRKSELAVRKFHEQMIAKGTEAMKSTADEDFQKREVNGITFPCDSEHVDLIKDKIRKLQDEIFALISGDEREYVYQMNIQLFPLTKKQGE